MCPLQHTSPLLVMIKKHFKYKHAFTLIELIISLSIGSLLILGVYQVFFQGIVTAKQSLDESTMEGVANRLSNDLRVQLAKVKSIDIALMRKYAVVMKDLNGNPVIDTTTGKPKKYNNDLYFNNGEKDMVYSLDYSNNDLRLLLYPNSNISPGSERVLEVLYDSPEDESMVRLVDIIFDYSSYNMSFGIDDNSIVNPDYATNPYGVIKYTIILEKTIGTSDVKRQSYSFSEVSI